MYAHATIRAGTLCDRLRTYGKQFDALSPSLQQALFRPTLDAAGVQFHRLDEVERRTHLVVQRAIYAASHLSRNPHLPYERLLEVALIRFLREIHGGRYARAFVANPTFKTILAMYPA